MTIMGVKVISVFCCLFGGVIIIRMACLFRTAIIMKWMICKQGLCTWSE